MLAAQMLHGVSPLKCESAPARRGQGTRVRTVKACPRTRSRVCSGFEEKHETKDEEAFSGAFRASSRIGGRNLAEREAAVKDLRSCLSLKFRPSFFPPPLAEGASATRRGRSASARFFDCKKSSVVPGGGERLAQSLRRSIPAPNAGGLDRPRSL